MSVVKEGGSAKQQKISVLSLGGKGKGELLMGQKGMCLVSPVEPEGSGCVGPDWFLHASGTGRSSTTSTVPQHRRRQTRQNYHPP